MSTSTTISDKGVVYSQCPVCRSQNIGKALVAKDFTVSQQSFEIWHCSDCSLRFTQSVPNEEQIGAYYQSEEYISHSNTQKGLVSKLYQIVRDFTLQQKLKLMLQTSSKKSGNILDIGCGTGEFLATMKKAGWKATGLEPDEGARNQGIQNQGLDVFSPEQLFELPKSQFDIITMWHVLEHVHRLDDYLSQIHDLLKEDGWFFIAVPNYSSLDAEFYEKEWAAYDVPRHLYHFTPNSMKVLLDRFGFEVKRMKSMPFDSFYVSLLSEKYRHGGVRLISGFWQGLRSWAKSTASPEKCSSVLYLVRKK
ncbi:class I SAM-dependent methyltransferase [Pontibacter sp. G13]|uniref:class I SAM-dependent methyltransferase n=1 Tax=Pontibacter sp. G13 TaxID=3074898 RepID=UPI0028895CA7|nr:class I SAM-dependent methyltransferase [Pontibacter sp. G13]WNJ15920.1 class I SAM-dependent methyltransferase [Pontibacter sp. G13]